MLVIIHVIWKMFWFFSFFQDGSIVENLDTLGTIPLIDAVIPEALTERAAAIYRLVAEKSEMSKKTFPQNVCKEEESIQSDAEVLLEGHKTEVCLAINICFENLFTDHEFSSGLS